MFVAEVRVRRLWGERVWGNRLWVPLSSVTLEDAVEESKAKADAVDRAMRFAFWPSPLSAAAAAVRVWSFVYPGPAVPVTTTFFVGGGGLVISYAPLGTPPSPEVSWVIKLAPRRVLQGGAVRREVLHVGPFATVLEWDRAVGGGEGGWVMSNPEYYLHKIFVESFEWKEIVAAVRLSNSSVWAADLLATKEVATLNLRRIKV